MVEGLSSQLSKQLTAHVLGQMGAAGHLCHLSLWKGVCYYGNCMVLALLGAENRHTRLLGTATDIPLAFFAM